MRLAQLDKAITAHATTVLRQRNLEEVAAEARNQTWAAILQMEQAACALRDKWLLCDGVVAAGSCTWVDVCFGKSPDVIRDWPKVGVRLDHVSVHVYRALAVSGVVRLYVSTKILGGMVYVIILTPENRAAIRELPDTVAARA